MGVVRYLCITILLAAVLSVSGDCGANGWAKADGNCICDSGYSGSDCSTNFGTCDTTTYPAKKDKDERFPVLDTQFNPIGYTLNHLTASIVGPIVPARRYNDIFFVHGTDPEGRLNSTGSWWTQSGDSTNCNDRFALDLSWLNWRGAGFDESDTADYYHYETKFVITYTDDLGTLDEVPEYTQTLYRHSSVAYKLYVNFQRIVTVTVNNVIVNSTTDLKVALVKFEYNPADLSVQIGFVTIVTWPAMFVRDTVQVALTNMVASVHTSNSANNQIAIPDPALTNDHCSVSASNCLQYFEVQVFLNDNTQCSFEGTYTLSGTVTTCRDDTPSTCTEDSEAAILGVSTTDVCANVMAEPTISGKLIAIEPHDATQTPVTEFVIGYPATFVAVMDTINDFNMTWVDIWVINDKDVQAGDDITDTGLQYIQWLYKGGVTQLDGFHNYNGQPFADTFTTSPVQLVVHDINEVTVNSNDPLNGNAAVTSTTWTPQFDLVFDSRIFQIPVKPNQDGNYQGFTVHARGKIVYRGNEQYQKRTEEFVDFVWSADSSSYEGATHVFLRSGSASAVKSSSSNTALLASLLPVAGIALVVVAVAVVAAVVIVKRKKNTSFVTLAN